MIALLSVSATPALSQSIRGVWRPAEIIITNDSGTSRHTTDVQPGLAIYTARHYSMTAVQGFAPRPLPSAQPTDEELVRLWRSFVANAGTYSLKDSTLSITPTVAKNPAIMSGATRTIRVHVVADSMWTTVREADGAELKAKWVNVERF
jgi:hypothetical protein